MIICGWGRLLAFTGGNQFWVLFVFNSLFSCASPIMLNGLSIVTISWFKDKERALATALIGLGAMLGAFFGASIPGFFSKGLDKKDPKQDINLIRNCILTANIIMSVISTFYLLLFRGKPKHPPSKLAAESAGHKAFRQKAKREMGKLLSTLCMNKDWVCNAIIFMLMFGT